jgi:hypothetical protein
MNSPKEKAKELVEKYKEFTEDNHAERYCNAKQCAIICVEISIEEIDNFNRHGGFQYRIDYLQEVKNEILKL